MPEAPTSHLVFIKIARETFPPIDPPIQGAIVEEIRQHGGWYTQFCLRPEIRSIYWKEHLPSATYVEPGKNISLASHIFSSLEQVKLWRHDLRLALPHLHEQAQIKAWFRPRIGYLIIKIGSEKICAHTAIFGTQVIDSEGATIGRLIGSRIMLNNFFADPLLLEFDCWKTHIQDDITCQVIWTENPKQRDLYMKNPPDRITDTFPAVSPSNALACVEAP